MSWTSVAAPPSWGFFTLAGHPRARHLHETSEYSTGMLMSGPDLEKSILGAEGRKLFSRRAVDLSPSSVTHRLWELRQVA